MRWLVACLALSLTVFAKAEPVEAPSTDVQYGETMTVVRYLIEARVTDVAGRAVTDIPPGEFSVTIGDVNVHVESAEWISFTRPQANVVGEAGPGAQPAPSEPEGRLIVFFIQTDFARDASRIKGHMAFTTFFADRLIGMLRPGDRVAVLAFDSHLKLLCDFTSNHEAVLEVIRESLDPSKVTPPAPSDGVTLAPLIDARKMKAAARAEEGLLLVANALSRIEGNKLMFLAGWGFGDMIWGMGGGGQIVHPREFSDAVGLLHRDRTPVITIGTGRGQLTTGIALTARATGGLHTSATADFPQQQLTRFEGFLAGYYELVLRADEPLAPGAYPITVRTKNPQYKVRAVPSIVVDVVDTRYGDAIELINAGFLDDGLRMLRDSMQGSTIPVDVLVERLAAFVDAAQWEAALVVVEQLEASGAVGGEIARLRDEAKRGAALRTKSGAHAKLTEARRSLLDGDGAKALALLDEAIALAPGLGEAWYERGMLLLSLGRAADAEASLRRYLELEPRGMNADTAREVLAGLEDVP